MLYNACYAATAMVTLLCGSLSVSLSGDCFQPALAHVYFDDHKARRQNQSVVSRANDAMHHSAAYTLSTRVL
jgi:hypothetical protein